MQITKSIAFWQTCWDACVVAMVSTSGLYGGLFQLLQIFFQWRYCIYGCACQVTEILTSIVPPLLTHILHVASIFNCSLHFFDRNIFVKYCQSCISMPHSIEMADLSQKMDDLEIGWKNKKKQR